MTLLLCFFHRIALIFLCTALPPLEQDLVAYIKPWPSVEQREHPSARCLGKGYPSDDIGDGPAIKKTLKRPSTQTAITRFFNCFR